ncbi:MAG: carbohydrate ABC transporter substrate-binding protein [Chthoniobacterales bacterium]|nr:carbohydrate ABC transporter substrate-binding protein [Chthoniobacterales bacterium]
MLELTGITWNHSRALPSLVATAQRYEELHPGVRIRWEKRSLHEFGHMPIDELARRFDLIVIDHPWAGCCFARGLVHDLAPLLSAAQRTDLEANSVGPSFESYLYESKLLAIPIDAATPTPSCRPDLLQRHSLKFPETWSELVALADAGHAVMPGFPADLFLNWSMLVAALGGEIAADPERICDPASGRGAMDLLRRLAEKMPAKIHEWNPIAIAEHMTRGDDIALCAFAYSYGNYCRPSFAARPLRYGPLPKLDDGRPLRSIVGGTGIAVSKKCPEVNRALDYALFTGSAAVQAGIYTLAGGQPSRREAWVDPSLGFVTGGFFRDSLADQEHCLVRPRYDGYVPLQEEAGVPLQQYLRGEATADRVWDEINKRYRDSWRSGHP